MQSTTVESYVPVLHRRWAFALIAGAVLIAGAASGQQIYRWTDANGKVHFGNQPPKDAKQPVGQDRARSEIEIECEGVARGKCHDFVARFGKWQDSDSFRQCMDRERSWCARLRPNARPTAAPERVITTPTLAFDVARGESLRCEMKCPTNCRGQVDIRADRVLKKGENLGIDRYAMEVTPLQSGAAFCKVATAHKEVQIVLSVVRDGSVTSVVEAQ